MSSPYPGFDRIVRDIKPENVLIRQWEPLRIALTDFGIASVAEAMQHFTTTTRTLRYAAPEAATGVIGAAADDWSLGMVVLEAVSGRHPFAGLSEAVLIPIPGRFYISHVGRVSEA